MAKTKTCPRCAGTGHYLFNQVHGTMCYGCDGKGIVPTSSRIAETVRRADCMRYAELRDWVGKIKLPWRRTQYDTMCYLTIERADVTTDGYITLTMEGGKQASHKAGDVFFPIGTDEETGERIDLRTGQVWKWDRFGKEVAA